MALNDDGHIVNFAIDNLGIQVSIEFLHDARKGIGRMHAYFVAFDHEEFGQQAKDIATSILELGEEVHAGYDRQPRDHAGED